MDFYKHRHSLYYGRTCPTNVKPRRLRPLCFQSMQKLIIPICHHKAGCYYYNELKYLDEHHFGACVLWSKYRVITWHVNSMEVQNIVSLELPIHE